MITMMLISGCTQPKGSEPAELKINVEKGYGNAVLTWDEPEEADTYDILISKHSGADGGAKAERIADTTCQSGYFQPSNYLAWYGYETGYFGPVRFQVSAYAKNQLIAQGINDNLMIQDVFPPEEELFFGTDVKAEDIVSLQYSGSGSSMEDNFCFSVRKDGDEVRYMADYTDVTGSHADDYEIAEEIFERILPELENGRIVRRIPDDPEIEMLDGSETYFRIEWKDETELQKSWYRFEPDEEETIINYLKGIQVKNG